MWSGLRHQFHQLWLPGVTLPICSGKSSVRLRSTPSSMYGQRARAATSRYSYLTMGLSEKRKQHLSRITPRSLESRKHRKVDRATQRKKEILRRQREDEDFWEEYEVFNLGSSSDEPNCEGYSQDGFSYEEEGLVIEDK